MPQHGNFCFSHLDTGVHISSPEYFSLRGTQRQASPERQDDITIGTVHNCVKLFSRRGLAERTHVAVGDELTPTIMTMLLLPSNAAAVAASLNSKLVASSTLLRKLVSSDLGAVQRRSHRMDASRSSLAQEPVVVKEATGKPVLLVDVMGTLVRDPFYQDIPAYFGMTMKELLAAKHPTAWIEFECGQLTEEELLQKFFADGRDFDIQGLKECMSKGYIYLEGVEGLLQRLLSAGYSMHAFSNYPCWYTMIEDKLQLSQYMPWTFVSCHMGIRKPDSEIYLEAARQLKLDPSSCVFVDDRRKNVEAAMAVGMRGIVFQNAKQMEEELVALGCSL